MFPDSFGVNLAVFALGQAIAWIYLRTGLVSRGVFVLVATWVCADAALVLRFAHADVGGWYVASLGGVQAIVAFEVVRLVWGWLRRRRPAHREWRDAEFLGAIRAYVRNELDQAVGHLQDVIRTDPWDLPARLALGAALGRLGRTREARRQLVSARRLDRDGRYGDAVENELGRCLAPGAVELAPGAIEPPAEPDQA